MKTTTLKAVLALVGVFTLGGLAGAGGVWAWVDREQAHELSAGPGERFAGRPLRALARELELTQEQRVQIREIMRRHQPERQRTLERLSGSCGQELRHERGRMDAEIRAVLTPEQQQRFEQLLEKRRTRFPLFEPGLGRPPPR